MTSPLAYNNYKNGNQNFLLIKENGKDPMYDFLKCKFEYNPEQFWKFSNLVNYESLTSGRSYGPLNIYSNETS